MKHCIGLAVCMTLIAAPAFGDSISDHTVVQFESTSDSINQKAHPQSRPIKDRVDHLDGTAESSNWSGYAVTGTDFTSASGSWVVPTVNCTGVSGDQYVAFWVGIDGYSSDTVEQTGTMSECDGTTAKYYAWYEFYPDGLVEFTSLPVTAGNVISASVVYEGSNKFTVTITNVTKGKTVSETATVRGAARSSAEWIAEAPCCTKGGGILPLADFSTGEFGMQYTNVNGTNYANNSTYSGRIGGFPTSDIVVIEKVGSSSSPQVSNCSMLSDETSFTCTWGATTTDTLALY